MTGVTQDKPPAPAAQTLHRRNRNSRCRARAGRLTNSQLQVSGINRHMEAYRGIQRHIEAYRASSSPDILCVNHPRMTCCQSNVLSNLCITCFLSAAFYQQLCITWFTSLAHNALLPCAAFVLPYAGSRPCRYSSALVALVSLVVWLPWCR